jgi:hypothetical protein
MKMNTERSILVILFLIAALSIVFSITKNPQYNGYYTETNTKVDASVDLGTSATYSGTPLVSGDRVCMGAVDLTALTTSLYASDPVQTSIGVECTRYDPALGQQCAGYAGGAPGLPSANISWVSQSDYNTAAGGFNVLVCKTRDRLPLPTYTGITLRDISANYYGFSGFYSGNKLIGAGTASIALFCYGTSNISYTFNGSTSQVPGSSLNLGTTSTITFNNPATDTGAYIFQANARVANCSMIARSWNTYGTADSTHPAQDCLYKDPTGTMTNLLVSGNSISITVLRGPVMNLTGPGIEGQISEGDVGNFWVTVKNDGDVNMTVNPAGITFDANFGYVSSIPAGAFNLAPGENQTITGRVMAPNNFLNIRNVTITIPYMGAEALIGTCDDPSTASVLLGEVKPAPPTQLTLRIVVDPTGIIRSTGHSVTINATLTRGIQRVPPVSSSNYTIQRWDNITQSWVWAPGWSMVKGFTFDYTPSDTELRGDASRTEPVHCLAFSESCQTLNADWPVGVYKVSVSVRDDKSTNYNRGIGNPDAPDVIEQRFTYFVIYTIGCEERS